MNPGYQPRYSFDRDLPQESNIVFNQSEQHQDQPNPSWTSFFHARTLSLTSRSGSVKFSDINSHGGPAYSKRVSILGRPQRLVHLVKPRMVSEGSATPLERPQLTEPLQEADSSIALVKEVEGETKNSSPASKKSKASNKSISMTLSSASDWVSRTSGSIRRPKRGADNKGASARSVSDKFIGSRPPTGQAHPAESGSSQPSEQGLASDSNTKEPPQTPAHSRRTISSPLPSFSRPSKFQEQLPNDSGSGKPTPQRLQRHNQPSSASSSAGMSHLPITRKEQARSDGADVDGYGFASGDDEDTDFKSERLFDSLRTVGSDPARALETPADSSFEDSPPVNKSAHKKNRLSIQAMLSEAWQEDTGRLSGEDSVLYPDNRGSSSAHRDSRPDPGFEAEASPLKDLPRDMARFSLDDDFDEYWTADDDAPFSPLSPPSNTSSLNSRGMNPNVRIALASNGLGDSVQLETQSERPLSTLFDWSEPTQDRSEADGHSPRPRTAYAKQEMDSRGGRSVTRKGPMPAHIRSQSVPVVHEGDEPKPSGSKYGTWATGTKPVSEDWGDDFDFGSSAFEDDTKGDDSFFAVPDSIKATQPSVKAHSGQIREFSLLVNDLKRLCRHGRDMDMLGGPYQNLWKEAEGIIALASPDEEDSWAEDAVWSTSSNPDAFDASERSFDGFDRESFDQLDATFDDRDVHISKSGVVKERSSPRRRSVFAPDDDIFGVRPATADIAKSNRSSRPRTPENYPPKGQDVLGVVRSMIEVMDRRPPMPGAWESNTSNSKGNRMQFDTNSLKALVKRASDLRDILSDIIRKADQIMASPARTPRIERRLESSPAFTRVFDDPGSSPPRRGLRSRTNTALRDQTPPENSPSSTMSRGIQAMTVN